MKIIPSASQATRTRQRSNQNPRIPLWRGAGRRKAFLLLFFVTSIAFGVVNAHIKPADARSRNPLTDFTGWHWPLPAGEWAVSRGACNAATPYDHNCVYYEERCALDFVPTTGSMEDLPVLAPQTGQVLFLGTRDDTGPTLLLQHPDGRVSGYMHLSKIVVGADEVVAQGQVLGYAGHTGVNSGNAHLHFFVQPNAVERECLPLEGLDTINYVTLTANSRNLPWEQLTLTDPPQALLERLPPLTVSRTPDTISTQLNLSPGVSVTLPLKFTGALSSTVAIRGTRSGVRPDQSVFWITIAAQPTATAGRNYGLWLSPRVNDELRYRQAFKLVYAVRSPANTAPATGLLLTNPVYLSPTSYNSVGPTPDLCWSTPRSAGLPPFEYRVLMVGPTTTDSGWLGETCWQPPSLSAGTYYWKVLVRDARGFMNRTNQRPYAFIVSTK